MRPVATDGVGWCVCVSVCLLVTFVSHANTAEPIELPFWAGDSGGPKESWVRWGSRSLRGWGNFGGLFGPLTSIVSNCCGVRSVKSITASARLLQPTALLPTGGCDIDSPPPVKIASFAMRLFVKIFCPLVCYSRPSVYSQDISSRSF